MVLLNGEMYNADAGRQDSRKPDKISILVLSVRNFSCHLFWIVCRNSLFSDPFCTDYKMQSDQHRIFPDNVHNLWNSGNNRSASSGAWRKKAQNQVHAAPRAFVDTLHRSSFIPLAINVRLIDVINFEAVFGIFGPMPSYTPSPEPE